MSYWFEVRVRTHFVTLFFGLDIQLQNFWLHIRNDDYDVLIWHCLIAYTDMVIFNLCILNFKKGVGGEREKEKILIFVKP